MVPLNVIKSVTRTVSLLVRLFGNVMSGVFIVGIALSLAGLLVLIPLMALDLLTGADVFGSVSSLDYQLNTCRCVSDNSVFSREQAQCSPLNISGTRL